MLKPKQAGRYPDREANCQEAISQGIANVIDDAVAAVWLVKETANVIKVVSTGMYSEYTYTGFSK